MLRTKKYTTLLIAFYWLVSGAYAAEQNPDSDLTPTPKRKYILIQDSEDSEEREHPSKKKRIEEGGLQLSQSPQVPAHLLPSGSPYYLKMNNTLLFPEPKHELAFSNSWLAQNLCALTELHVFMSHRHEGVKSLNWPYNVSSHDAIQFLSNIPLDQIEQLTTLEIQLHAIYSHNSDVATTCTKTWLPLIRRAPNLKSLTLSFNIAGRLLPYIDSRIKVQIDPNGIRSLNDNVKSHTQSDAQAEMDKYSKLIEREYPSKYGFDVTVLPINSYFGA